MDNKKMESMKELLKVVIPFTDKLPFGQIIPSTWKPPKGYVNEKFKVGEVPVEHLIPKDKKTNTVILQFHGSGYVLALMDSCRDAAVRYSEIAQGAEVFTVDYRVAPTYRYPAALEDAIEVYKWLLDSGYDSSNILVAGDSAGGNAALALTLYLKDNKMPLPKAVLVLSPWTNAANDFPATIYNYNRDLILGKYGAIVGKQVKEPLYFEGADVKKDPYASPVLGDYKGFPNMLIQTGEYEMLADDAKYLYQKAKLDGANVRLTVFEEMPHDFQMCFFDLEETKEAWKEMQEFIENNM